MENIEQLQALLNKPMVEWKSAIDSLPTSQRGDVLRDCDYLVEQVARLRGYLDGRYGHGCGDQGHADSVKSSNKLIAKVRKALGFNVARKDVSF